MHDQESMWLFLIQFLITPWSGKESWMSVNAWLSPGAVGTDRTGIPDNSARLANVVTA